MSELADNAGSALDAAEAAWRPLTAAQRRVLGVLVEKAKTTPDAYPLTLNAVTTGCNQKSNRSPQMQLSPDEVEEVLEQLRDLGAVAEIQTTGRTAKFRHRMYEWMRVEKVELAVMAELLLRGAQTVGELRQRAARMEKIPDLAALRPILQQLIGRGLVVPLSAEGRGQTVTHGLYQPHEREHPGAPSNAAPPPTESVAAPAVGPPSSARAEVTRDMFNELQVEVAQLQVELARLRQEVRTLQEHESPP